MTTQVLDTISIDGRNHYLSSTAQILPPGLAERIGLVLEPESTANYHGWKAHWRIGNGMLWLDALAAFGHLRTGSSTVPLEVITGNRELKDYWLHHVAPRWISFAEIFGTEPPVFAAWLSSRLVAVCNADDTRYSRDDSTVTGASTRYIGVENGRVVSDEIVPNPNWDPARSEHRRREARRERALGALTESKSRGANSTSGNTS